MPEKERKFSEVQFLVHPLFEDESPEDPLPGGYERHARELFKLYSSKITALAKENSLLVIVLPPGSRVLNRYPLFPLINLAKDKLGLERVMVLSHVDSQLSDLRDKVSSEARLVFFGEHRMRCVHGEALRFAHELGVAPEDLSKRVTFNFRYSPYQKRPVELNFLERLREMPADERKRFISAERELQKMELKLFSLHFLEYQKLRNSGQRHELALRASGREIAKKEPTLSKFLESILEERERKE